MSKSTIFCVVEFQHWHQRTPVPSTIGKEFNELSFCCDSVDLVQENTRTAAGSGTKIDLSLARYCRAFSPGVYIDICFRDNNS